MATIAEIAAAAGCSPATVSKALNGYPHVKKETKQKVLEVCDQLGFTPNYFARSLMSKRSYLTGILIADEFHQGLMHPLFNEMIEGFRQSVEARGYEVLIIKEDFLYSMPGFVEHCRQRGLEGVLVVIGHMRQKSIPELIASDIACVSIDLFYPDLPTVLADNFNGGYMATSHLLGLGHRRIAHICGRKDKPAGIDRLQGYIKALRDYHVRPDPKLVAQTSNYEPSSGREAVRWLLSQKTGVTAIFAASDMLAMGAIAALRAEGLRVPEDVSVVGFDDISSAAYFSPPLTTIRQNRVGTGRAAGHLLIDLMENPNKTEAPHHVFPVELIERESARPPSAQ